jgi:phosphatidylserine synthase
LFIVCGATRLAYFNTLSNEHPGKMMKSFRGVPIPISTVVITILFLFTAFIPANITVWIFRIALAALAIGFVLNIKIKKPDTKQAAVFLVIQIVILVALLLAGDFNAPIA